jgi:hypothetical protein
VAAGNIPYVGVPLSIRPTMHKQNSVSANKECTNASFGKHTAVS